ncbi:MAG: hypothetical protein AAB558_02160 [Patescibacteria group bacterium]
MHKTNRFHPSILTSASLAAVLPMLARAATTTYTLPNPFGSAQSPAEVVVNVIEFALGLIGLLALVMFIYGGFVILTAHGNADQFKKGTHTLLYAVLGMAVILTSYSVLNYIFTNIYGFTA